MTRADVQMLVDAAVAAERNRCASIADQHACGQDAYCEAACNIADEIRGLVTCEDCAEQRPVAVAECSKCAEAAAYDAAVAKEVR